MLRRLLLSCLIVAAIAAAGCGGVDVDQLLTDLSSEDVDVRRAAARELGERKPPGAEVETALANSINDPDRDVRRLTCFALGELPANDVEPLATALQDAELSVRLAAAYALLKIESEHAGAIDVLNKAMRSGDGGVIVAVSQQGPESAWAVPTLTALLADRRAGIRRLAAEGLGKIGTASQTAVPELKKATRDGDDRVRAAAAEAIQSIENPSTPPK